MRNDISIYSFDVFDTCLARLYHRPKDLFLDLGQKICPSNLSEEDKNIFVDSFYKQRILAEENSNRAHGKKKSCHFNEIYNSIVLPKDCVFTKEKIAELELKLEKENIYPIKTTLELIEKYRSTNTKIIYISDMYLDKSFIKSLLVDHNFFKGSDELYVSSENTLTKRSGALFQHVLSAEKIQPEEMLHHGDDLVADIRRPKRMGIKTQYISESHFQPSENPTPREENCLSASRINATLKHLRLTRFQNLPKDRFPTLNTITLLLTEFVLWAFTQAQKKGINSLYFLAKDNDITYKIAKQLNIYFPSIAVKYLYGSRRAWLAPSINLSDPTWKRLAIPNGKQSSAKDALERINLPQEKIKKISQISGISDNEITKATTKLKCSELLEKICAHNHCRALLNEHISIERETCLKYFKQEGLLNHDDWAIVDTGWALNCQAALKRIIDRHNSKANVVGFYFGLSNDHLPQKMAGKAYSFTQIGSIFSRRPIAVEHCFFASTHASTTGYVDTKNGIVPIFARDHRTEHEVNYTNNLHSFAAAFTDQLCKLNIPIEHLTSFREVFTQNASLLLESPNIGELSPIRGIKVSGDSRHTEETFVSIFSPLNVGDLIKVLFLYIKKRQHEIDFIWLEASVADSNTVIRLLFKVLFLAKKKHAINSVIEYTNKAE